MGICDSDFFLFFDCADPVAVNGYRIHSLVMSIVKSLLQSHHVNTLIGKDATHLAHFDTVTALHVNKTLKTVVE